MSDAPRAADAAEIVLRPVEDADIEAVLAIEHLSFTTPWQRSTFESLLHRLDADLVAAERDGRLLGYAVTWTVLDQAELGNVAVDPAERGRGVGRNLVLAALDRVARRGARECFLEVRESNLGAQHLYGSLGFEVVGRRKRYYARPVEDALVMRIRLDWPVRHPAAPIA